MTLLYVALYQWILGKRNSKVYGADASARASFLYVCGGWGIASGFEMICEEWKKYFLVEEIKFYC